MLIRVPWCIVIIRKNVFYVLILVEDPTHSLNDNMLINADQFYRVAEEFCLSLHYNEVNSYILVNGIEIYKFKAKESVWTMFQKKISVDNMTNTTLYGYECDFSVDFDSIDNADILDTRVLIKFCKTRFL